MTTLGLRPEALAYVRESLRACDVDPDSTRAQFFLAEMQAGREWHPKVVGEVRAAIAIMVDAIEGRPVAREALMLVGPVLEEDCIA
jgi:hypothetical protein